MTTSDSARAKVLLEQKIETFILMFLIIILVKLVEKNHFK
jgi:hypothetical protein